MYHVQGLAETTSISRRHKVVFGQPICIISYLDVFLDFFLGLLPSHSIWYARCMTPEDVDSLQSSCLEKVVSPSVGANRELQKSRTEVDPILPKAWGPIQALDWVLGIV